MARALHGDAVFRANPDYKLVLLDRLTAHDRNQLQAADATADLYGALVPHGASAQGWRAVSCDTALLFMALAEAGALPQYLLRRSGHDLASTIERLVLDGVLQIALDGQFISGPQVAPLFGFQQRHGGGGHQVDLAVAALRYGQELSSLAEAELGQRLYAYGRKPVSPQWQARLATPAAVADFLGTGADGALVRALQPRWTLVPVAHGGRDYWWQWLSAAAPPRGTAQRASYKLYVSPVVDAMPAALQAIIAALPRAQGVTGFKVGVGLAGMARPDKMLVYFNELDDLFTFAELLRTRLSGCAAHGVPFTAAASEDGLLSWGADPPRSGADGARGTSWRMWVSWRLAEYLVAARGAAPEPLQPWQYALGRLGRAGIDTTTWIPANGMWPTALEMA